ncbi:hypothetical protein [Pseudoalteromonas sp. Of7M-16]|uniref:hypothetical protein n=1 Tax=Pseudoalteromonas sp. Of7M-16 TaxID=2917756 RepID=UPI001EF5331F|nr:hypothetical protein [Pseudoalteromonas sp. Of7M-16]MCG7550890.1 hypothetical protein [Pseudoalteromonas sp. Of7M-16]
MSSSAINEFSGSLPSAIQTQHGKASLKRLGANYKDEHTQVMHPLYQLTYKDGSLGWLHEGQVLALLENCKD